MLSRLSLDWPQFVAAAFLLLIPLPLFFGKGVEFRELTRSWERVWPRALSLPWHWIDLVRVAGGTWLLKAAIGLNHRGVVLNGDEEMQVSTGHTALAVAAGVLILGMVIQAVGCRAQGMFFIPFTYVLAATALWFPPLLATLALISAISAALACHTLNAFLWALPLCLGGLCVWLYPNWLMLATGVALSLGGALLPLLFQRDYAFVHRAVPVDPELSQPLR